MKHKRQTLWARRVGVRASEWVLASSCAAAAAYDWLGCADLTRGEAATITVELEALSNQATFTLRTPR